MSWRSEFGDEYEVPENISASLYDASWHNDSAPRFWRKEDPASDPKSSAEMPLYDLWVEHPDPAQRELGGKRFTVVKWVPKEGADDVESVTLIETDDESEALHTIMSQPTKSKPVESAVAVIDALLNEDCHVHYEAIKSRVGRHIDAAEKAHHAGDDRAAAAQINGAIIYLQAYTDPSIHSKLDS
jgi:hypothetical protein